LRSDTPNHPAGLRAFVIPRRNKNNLKNISLKFVKEIFCKFCELNMFITSRHHATLRIARSVSSLIDLPFIIREIVAWLMPVIRAVSRWLLEVAI